MQRPHRGQGATPAVPAIPPRSLAEDLRTRSADALRELLQARPDLLHPMPPDLGQLAARAATGASTARAMDALDSLALQVLEVLAAAAGPVSIAAVLSAFGADEEAGNGDPVPPASDLPEAITERVDLLRRLALAWGPTQAMQAVRPVREMFGPFPCGLAPSTLTTHRVARYVDDPEQLAQVLADAPEQALGALDRLAWGPPGGQVSDARRLVSRSSAATAVEWLLARDLLIPTDDTTVVIPRVVALARRAGRWITAPAWPGPAAGRPPSLPSTRVEATAGAAAADFVRAVTDLLEAWSVQPPAVLRGGGVSLRDLSAAARLVDADEPTAAAVIETAHAAGLLVGDGEVAETWLPSLAYDAWLTRPVAEQWATLALAWMQTSRLPGLAGTRDERGSRRNALAPESVAGTAAAVRAEVLAVLADLPPGLPGDPDGVRAALGWRRPRLGGPARDQQGAWVLAEAEILGVTAAGALSAPGRALVAVGPPQRSAIAAALAPHLPTPLDHVLLQADLTAVAPGPLEPALARTLTLLADVESTGGATVLRFSESSLRRGLDAGQTAEQILALLERHSRTPVPQPLRYLVSDVARRHGGIRVGLAGSYIRSDDEPALRELLVDRRLRGLGLIRLAPTVLAATASTDEVLRALRTAGRAPVAEAPDGTVLIRRPDSRRAATRPSAPLLAGPFPVPPDRVLDAAVRALLAAERDRSPGEGTDEPGPGAALPRGTARETMVALRAAIAAGAAVRIGYADETGAAAVRLVEPLGLQGGHLTAYDHRAQRVTTFAVSRVTGIAPAGGS